MTEKHKLGHRQRVRDKFLEHGAGIFEDYELLELLLFYSTPVKDTKGIAKELLSELGSGPLTLTLTSVPQRQLPQLSLAEGRVVLVTGPRPGWAPGC